MKEKIHLVIVEDDNAQQQMYKDSIEEYNLASENYEIQCSILANGNDIPQILFNDRIDLIIIDLDLGTGAKDAEGNALVKKIYKDCRIPIFIVSGNIHLLDEDYNESAIFKKYTRDTVDIMELLTEIQQLYSTGYTHALGANSKIDEMLTKVFWNHMSNIIFSWQNQDRDLQTQRMLRFAVSRITGMLEFNDENKHDKYDAIEFYMEPTKNSPFTGDIINYKDKKYIVITAACDMEQDGSAEFIVLCGITFDKVNSLIARLKKEESKTAEKELQQFIRNSKQRLHLLPPCSMFDGGLVDFQMVKSVSKEDFNEFASVVKTINPVFVKDIQARFSHYYGRQGQPELNYENIIKWIKEKQ